MNIIAVFNKNYDKVLMCKRVKEPYKGLLNLVGGKVENDNYLDEAYRELYEETGITKNDISLTYLMVSTYFKRNIELQVYYGILNKDVILVEEVNKLEWVNSSENFFDMKKFAGEGNIGHILEQIKLDLQK